MMKITPNVLIPTIYSWLVNFVVGIILPSHLLFGHTIICNFLVYYKITLEYNSIPRMGSYLITNSNRSQMTVKRLRWIIQIYYVKK